MLNLHPQKANLLVYLLAIGIWFLIATQAQSGPDVYKALDNSNWWQRQLNQKPWLRRTVGGDFRFEKSVAIVVGIGTFRHWENLASPTQDAKRVSRFLKNNGFDVVHTLLDDDASRERVDRLISDVARNLDVNDRFLFYWAGHGGRGDIGDGAQFGFLPFSDTTFDGQGNYISMSEFRIWAQRIRARHTLFILDSCFSGSALPVARSPTGRITLDRLAKPADHVFTSSASGQESFGFRDGSGGLFTRAFLDSVGANGTEQMADFNNDGFITLSEIGARVKERLDAAASRYSFIMSPQVSSVGSTEGEFFFLADEFTAEVIEDEERSPSQPEARGRPPADTFEDELEFRKSLTLTFSDVVEIQGRLLSLGFDPIGVDGQMGPNTRAAIKKWQKENSQEPSGYLSIEQLESLREQTDESYVRPTNFGTAGRSSSRASERAVRSPPSPSKTNTSGVRTIRNGCMYEPDGTLVIGYNPGRGC